jgi:DNA-binding MarR family transcriptional regulator
MNKAESAYRSLVRSQMLLGDSDDRFFEQFRVRKTRYYALFHIHQITGISLSELSKHLLCTKGNTTRIVRSLEQDGYLTRRPDPDDSRGQCLALTDKGKKMLTSATEAYLAHKIALFACLTGEQIDTLIQTLETLSQGILVQSMEVWPKDGRS